ncbi:hypothetical protein ABZ656_55390 [Streptomyces sp. NPDC007095]|uniref:hypothetical protein n=1 Tax=Streptomyces sp. NPDC007095 TaxID=3154482 RepID=UPI0033C15D99
MRSRRRRPQIFRAVVGILTAALLGAASVGPAQAAANDGRLKLGVLSFSPSSVDATAEGATATLDWTVTNGNASAATVSGDVYIRQITAGGSAVGSAYDISYSLRPDGSTMTSSVSGNAQSSTYSYDFSVPQYAAGPSATWAVVRVTASDDQGNTLTVDKGRLSEFASTVTAKELVDSAGPTYEWISVPPDQPTYLYNAAKPVTVAYDIEVVDPESGFYKGEVTVAGPGGQTASGKLKVVTAGDGTTSCGPNTGSWGINDMICGVSVTIPAGAAAGTWAVSRIRLTDNAGNTSVHRNLNLAPVQVTQNGTLQASDFSITPKAVNNWSAPQKLSITMQPNGVRQGLASATVWTDTGCGGSVTQAPVISADGTITVTATMFQTYDKECTITGIALVDGAGDVAAYGSYFDEPDLNLVVTQIPDTTPPVATSASLSFTTVAASALPRNVELTADVTSFAGVNGYSLTIYDSTGDPVGGGYGGLFAVTDGTVQIVAGLSQGLAPGVYTVGFTLTDSGGLHAQYGYPGNVGSPAPSGPLQITVTDS